MRQSISKLCICLVLVAALSGAEAQPRQCGIERDVPMGTLDEPTWRQLNTIYEDVGEGNYDLAHENLTRLMGRAGRDRYLQAVLNQAMAQVEWSRNNYDASLRYFEKAVELDTLPNEAHFALMYQIAQLYFMKNRYDEALEKLDLWFCTVPAEKVTSAAWVLKASIHAQKKDFPNTLTAIETAIEMDPDPKEEWFLTKLAAHFELEQYPQAADTLELLIARWPDKKLYWTQLAQVYYKLKQDSQALAVMALAYRRGMLDKSGDIIFLSSLYSHRDVPFKAAEVLEQGLRDGIVPATQTNWTVAADTWYAAEEYERALAAYEEAGKASDDGNIDLRRAYILVDMERWQVALEALDRALDKGGLDERRIGEAYLLRGMAQFNLGNFDSASADWGRAGRYERTRDAARQWMNHLQEERRRRAS